MRIKTKSIVKFEFITYEKSSKKMYFFCNVYNVCDCVQCKKKRQNFTKKMEKVPMKFAVVTENNNLMLLKAKQKKITSTTEKKKIGFVCM